MATIGNRDDLRNKAIWPWRKGVILVSTVAATAVTIAATIIVAETVRHGILVYFEDVLKIDLPEVVHEVLRITIAILIVWSAVLSTLRHMLDVLRTLFEPQEVKRRDKSGGK